MVIQSTIESLSKLPALHQIALLVITVSIISLSIWGTSYLIRWWSSNYIAKGIYVNAFFNDESIQFKPQNIDVNVIQGKSAKDPYIPLVKRKLHDDERLWNILIENRTGFTQEGISVKVTFDKPIKSVEPSNLVEIRHGGNTASFINFSVEKIHPKERASIKFISNQELPISIEPSISGTLIPNRIIKLVPN